MNYDFLQSYNIPSSRQSSTTQYANASHATMEGAYGSYSLHTSESTPTVNTAYYGYGSSTAYDTSYQSSAGTTSDYYQSSERYAAASKYGTSYYPKKTIYKRKTSTIYGGSGAKKEAPIPEYDNDGKLAMFLGRDESYPDELNSLIHPLSCDLCNTKMNSSALAKDHYESKSHDKHIASWLYKNYTEKGQTPPEVKRFIKQGSTGPDAYYCESCDLKLTSLTHANQHYAGKKHRLVVTQKSKPSGAGFYNSEGKWVRTGTKATPKASKDGRFGIGESFRLAEILESTTAGVTTTSVADTTTNAESEVKKSTFNQDPALFCSVCSVSVTSAVQMTTHITGSKHLKKLKSAGIEPTTENKSDANAGEFKRTSATDNYLLSAIKEEIKPNTGDLSMYRTPSGQYYCKTCNTSMSTMQILEQHLKGKRHMKKLTEEKAMASLSAKKI